MWPSRRRLWTLVLIATVSWPGVVGGWGTLTGGLNMSEDDQADLKWLLEKYGLDPKTLLAQYDARTGSHPIHQFIVQQAWTVLTQDPAAPAIADDQTGLPALTAINAWDGIERCEQGMRERTPSTLMPITELAPPKAPGDSTSRPGADAEIDASGGWNPAYNGKSHYWNPWLEDGDAPRMAGENYERLAVMNAMGGDADKRAHYAAYLAHYVSDPVSAKHADAMTLDDASITKLVDISKRWIAALKDEIEVWIASPIITEAVDVIESRAHSVNPGQAAAWLARVRAHIGDIGGGKLLQRGWWYASWVDIADSSLRSAVGCYLHELAARPTSAGGEVKPLDKFYSYFDPFYFNGPIYNPAFYAPSFKLCVPLSEHLYWETNPEQYDLVKATMSAPGEATTIFGKPDPKAIYLPWQRKPGFASFDDKVATAARADTAADLVKRCSLLAHEDVGSSIDFASATSTPFRRHLELAVRCVATALRASVTALRGEGWARRTPDGRMRAQLVIENLADVPAKLLGARFAYLDATGKRVSAPGWTVDLGGRAVPPGEPVDIGAQIDGVPADVAPQRFVVELHTDLGTLPDSGLLFVPLTKRETRRVYNPAGGKLVKTKGPIDVVVVMDTTGSMQASIDSMRDNAIASIRRLREQTDDVRMAVVTFRDRGVESDAKHFLVQGFTDDLESQFVFMRGLVADGGGDTPEDQLDGLSRAIALWEAEPQDEDRVPAKIIVVITDAPAKDPDSAGNTFDTIAARAFAVDPAHIYPIVVGNHEEAMRHAARLAESTEGKVLTVATGDEVAAALLAAVDTAAAEHPPEPSRGGPHLVLGVVAIVLVVGALASALVALRVRRTRKEVSA